MNKRQTQAIRILFRGGAIRKVNDSKYAVKPRVRGPEYTIKWRNGKWTCQCREFKKQGKACEHIYSILYLMRLPTILLLNTNYEAFTCPQCGAAPDNIGTKGERDNKTGRVQIFICKKCGHKFSSTLGFSKPRHDPLLIVAAIDLYMKNLSFRQVQQHLEAIYGCEVTAMTVHNWVKRYMKIVSNYVHGLRPRIGGQWHADEMVLKTKQPGGYLWNVLDRKTRFLLVSTLTRGRGEKEALRILSQGIRSVKRKPSRLITDGLKSYDRPAKSLKIKQHISGPHFSNPSNNTVVERLNETLRTRYNGIRLLGGVRSGGAIAEAMRVNYNFIRPHMSLGGHTPAEQAGIHVESRNKLHYFLTAASHHRNGKTQHRSLPRNGNS